MHNELVRPVRPERPAIAAASARPVPPRPRREAELWPLPGLCWNAKVTTSFGELPVQALRLRDPVRTASGAFLPVKWIDQIHLDEDFLAACPDAQPVLIPAHAFGASRPSQPLALSPAQRLNVARGDFGTELRSARELLKLPGVARKPESGLTYFLFHCGEPALVRVDGVWIPTAP